jgi:pyridoxal phosphate enzyme (YggS family)
MSNITERYKTLLIKAENASQMSPLALRRVILLAAAKSQPLPVLKEAILLGIKDFGENRVQEAEEKWPELLKSHSEIKLHLIGGLQTNKVKEAISLFDVIQTLDRKKLADEIAKHWNAKSKTKEFYIQVNTGEEPQKSGVAPKDTKDFISYCRSLHLPVVGLMCVPPADRLPAPHFALLKKIADENGLKNLSMGMSGDFETAIRMGSTCIRIGTALFGERNN